MRLTDDPNRPFWIRPLDHERRPIDPALIRAAEEVWPRVTQLTRDGLNDGSSAAELLEQIVQELADSQRTGDLPAELSHPRALLLIRFYQRLINRIRRERRIFYVGTLFELESLSGRSDKNTRDIEILHERVLIAQLLALMEPDSRRLVVLRLFDYRWSTIGRLLGMKTGTIRERYRVALKRLRDRLSSVPKDPEDGTAR